MYGLVPRTDRRDSSKVDSQGLENARSCHLYNWVDWSVVYHWCWLIDNDWNDGSRHCRLDEQVLWLRWWWWWWRRSCVEAVVGKVDKLAAEGAREDVLLGHWLLQSSLVKVGE